MASTFQSSRFGTLTFDEAAVLRIPRGLIGIPDDTWLLVTREPDSPFMWLQSLIDPDLAIVVTRPERFFPDYQLQISQDQLTALGFTDGHLVETLCLVRADQDITAFTINLLGPLVFDADTQTGAQLVNLADYEVAESLWKERGINQLEDLPQLKLPVILVTTSEEA